MLGSKDEGNSKADWIQSKMFRSLTNAELSLHFLDQDFL